MKRLKSPRFVPTVLIHGGAGDVTTKILPAKAKGIKCAVRHGFDTLKQTGCVVEAVQGAVRCMELNPVFNAGYGAVLTSAGTIQMDAAIMRGSDLSAGCVSLVHDICHPVSLARCVMEYSRHTYLAGESAMEFADALGFDQLCPDALITEDSVNALRDYLESLEEARAETANDATQTDFGAAGTVGAVAIDQWGHMAAATSTGGLTGKLPGRIGDSAIIGAGTLADDHRGAVSATGHGETFMQYNAAARILAGIEYGDLSAKDAAKQVLDEMEMRFHQTGGVVSVDRRGKLGIYFTTDCMPWAYQIGEYVHWGINRGEEYIEHCPPESDTDSDKDI